MPDTNLEPSRALCRHMRGLCSPERTDRQAHLLLELVDGLLGTLHIVPCRPTSLSSFTLASTLVLTSPGTFSPQLLQLLLCLVHQAVGLQQRRRELSSLCLRHLSQCQLANRYATAYRDTRAVDRRCMVKFVHLVESCLGMAATTSADRSAP